jgi:hypothetical protein
MPCSMMTFVANMESSPPEMRDTAFFGCVVMILELLKDYLGANYTYLR